MGQSICDLKHLKLSGSLKFFMMIVVGFYFLRDGLGVELPIVLIIASYMIGFLLLCSEESICFFLFLIPLCVGPLLYLLNVVFGLVFVLKNLYRIKIDKALIMGCILIFWEGMHVLLNTSLGFNESIIKFFGFSLVLCVVILCISNEKLRPNFVKCVYSWCFGFGVLCGILMFKYIYLVGLGNYAKVVRRLGWLPSAPGVKISSTTLLMNPNLVGKLSILSIFCLLNVLRFEKKHAGRIMFGVFCFVLFGILSVSRSFFLVAFLLFSIYVMEILFNFKDNKKIAILLCLVGVLLAIFSILCMGDVLEFWEKRLQSEDITGSRDVIYIDYIKALGSSFYLIFGCGMQDYVDKFALINPNISASTHNIIIEVFVIWGLIGIIIVTLLFFALYRVLNINNNILKRTVLPYLPLLGLFLSSQFGQFFISYYHTLPTLILGFISIKFADEKINLSSKYK